MSENFKKNLELFAIVVSAVLVADFAKSQIAKRKISRPLEVKPE